MVTRSERSALRVMLVDVDASRASWVERCLIELGFESCSVVSDPVRLLKAISVEAPDIVIIDMESPGRDILESLSVVAEHQPTPVVMFSEEEDPDYIARAVAAGVSTYLIGSIDPEKVRPVIEVALAQFRSFQQLRTALDETRVELSHRRSVDAAKMILMRTASLDENQAYEYMRKQAMNCGLRIEEIAQRILANQEG